MSHSNATAIVMAASLILPAAVYAAAAKPAAKRPAPAKKPAAAGPGAKTAAPASADAALAQIEKLGGHVGEIAQNDDHLEVSYHLQGASITDAALAPVSSLKKVVRLDLGQTGVTDAG